MQSSSEAGVRNGSEPERAYQAQVASLTDRLLLSIRDGAWTKVADLALWLAPRVKPQLAVQRFLASGGTHAQKLADKAGQGQKLILQDILDALQREKLITIRTNQDGRAAA